MKKLQEKKIDMIGDELDKELENLTMLQKEMNLDEDQLEEEGWILILFIHQIYLIIPKGIYYYILKVWSWEEWWMRSRWWIFQSKVLFMLYMIFACIFNYEKQF